LKGDKHTGVSLQTLDDKAFDHGTVLAQTPKNSFAIPENASLPDLTAQLGDIGAEMLVQGLRDGVHVPPHKDVSSHDPELKLRHAPKVSKAESEIDWDAGQSLPSEVLERKLKGIMQVFGSAWTEAATESGKTKRLVFKDVEAVRRSVEGNQRLFMRLANGQERAVIVEKSTQKCLIHWRDDLWVSVGEVTGHGSTGKPAAHTLRGYMFKKNEA
jgi:methionyl-tRNA formyltransferase